MNGHKILKGHQRAPHLPVGFRFASYVLHSKRIIDESGIYLSTVRPNVFKGKYLLPVTKLALA